jgi:hypothetical protein
MSAPSDTDTDHATIEVLDLVHTEVLDLGLDALLVAARRLRELDADRFLIVLELCRTYVAAFDRPEESDEIFASRLAQLRVNGPKN